MVNDYRQKLDLMFLKNQSPCLKHPCQVVDLDEFLVSDSHLNVDLSYLKNEKEFKKILPVELPESHVRVSTSDLIKYTK